MAFRVCLTAASSVGAHLLYVFGRGLGAPAHLAALGVLATMATAALTHWSGALDHFALAVPTIALPLTMLAAMRPSSFGFQVPAVAVSGSVTVSNAIMGLLALLARFGLRTGVATFAHALFALTGLAGFGFSLCVPLSAGCSLIETTLSMLFSPSTSSPRRTRSKSSSGHEIFHSISVHGGRD